MFFFSFDPDSRLPRNEFIIFFFRFKFCVKELVNVHTYEIKPSSYKNVDLSMGSVINCLLFVQNESLR